MANFPKKGKRRTFVDKGIPGVFGDLQLAGLFLCAQMPSPIPYGPTTSRPVALFYCKIHARITIKPWA